jgi:hypothetical protein
VSEENEIESSDMVHKFLDRAEISSVVNNCLVAINKTQLLKADYSECSIVIASIKLPEYLYLKRKLKKYEKKYIKGLTKT